LINESLGFFRIKVIKFPSFSDSSITSISVFPVLFIVKLFSKLDFSIKKLPFAVKLRLDVLSKVESLLIWVKILLLDLLLFFCDFSNLS